MATKFLDYTGLSYLWGKIKTWCNSIFVTKATDEDITGTKTFLGSKKIAFKQSGANDKLGFTLYNNSSKEQGYLEYNPTNKIANVPLFTLGNYATAANELSYIGFRRYSSISGASGAYNLLAPLISDAKTPFNLTTTYTNFYLPLGISYGTNIVTASNSGVVDISSLLSGFLTSTSTLDATKLSGTIPSSCYTNTTYTAGTGLSLSGTQFSLASHNQASNTIDAMTGYSKPSSGSAIAASDSLNSAIGKLEAKVDSVDDSNYVHLTGDETINGLKTFLVPAIYINHPTAEKGVYPDSGTQYWELYFGDANSNGIPDNDPGRIGELQLYQNSNGRLGIESTIRWVKDNINKSANIGIVYDSIGNYTYGYCPSTPLPSINNENTAIVTRDFIPKDTRIVHTTGDEDILGCKVFDALWVWNNSIDFLNLVNTGNDNEYLHFVDTNHSAYASIQTSTRVDLNRISFRIRKLGDTAGDMSGAPAMGIVCSSTYPNGYGYCPTISNLAEDSNVIATTEWVRDATGNTALNAATATDLKSGSVLSVAKGGTGLTSLDSFVRTTGGQTISGFKRFLSGVARVDEALDFSKTQTETHNSYFYFNDKNDVTAGCIQLHVTTGDVQLRLLARKIKDTTTSTSSLPNVSFTYYNDGGLAFEPNTNGTVSLGTSGNGRWKDVWASNNTIQTSDARLKTTPEFISDEVLDAWEFVEFYKFKMLEAVESKGIKNARFHSGVIAQQIQEIFQSKNININEYGFFCYNEWEAKEAEYDSEGNLDKEATPAGDEYSVRYGEILCVEAAYQRRKNKILEKRILDLETQLASVLEILQSLKETS